MTRFNKGKNLQIFAGKTSMILIILIDVVVVAILLGFSLWGGNSKSAQTIKESVIDLITQGSPSPLPFYELTIPYLRSRKYESSLGEFKKISENGSYISYLTSYDSDGLTINGQLTIPKKDSSSSTQNDKDRFPAVIFIHGYIPPKQYQTLVNYSSYVDYLARNGLVVFKIDLRGHANSEGEASGAYYSGDYVIDVLNAYSALAKADFVNPNKIGLWGHSMAGNVVMRSFAVKPQIAGVVIWSGAGYTYSDLARFGINDNSYQVPPNDSERQRRRRELLDLYGEFNPESPFWQKVAVTDYLSDLEGAIQIHHAVNDNVVNIEYSRNLMKLLDETVVPHELFEYPSGGHNLTGESFNLAMQRTVEFYDKYLKN